MGCLLFLLDGGRRGAEGDAGLVENVLQAEDLVEFPFGKGGPDFVKFVLALGDDAFDESGGGAGACCLLVDPLVGVSHEAEELEAPESASDSVFLHPCCWTCLFRSV